MTTKDGKEKAEPQLWETYEELDFIDAKDNQGDWRVGFIIQKSPHTKLFKVRFDGWSAKYDEYYRFTSPKLLDFRTLVIGYTGQKKNPGIRHDWKFNIQDHENRLNKLREFIQNPKKSAREINQFLRGHNYFYTDFLMTKSYQSLEVITSVMQYFKLNIKLVVNYIRDIDPEFKQYYRAQQVPEETHTVNSESALAHAFYEILDTFYIISGSYARLTGFFNDNTPLIKKYLNIDFEKNVKRYYQLHIFQQFMGNKGIEVIEDLIQNKLSEVKNVIPFLFLKSICSLYHSLGSQITYADKEPWLKQLVEITRKNIEKLTDKDIKDLNKSHVTDLLETIKQLFANSEEEKGIEEWAMETEVDFCHKMILCPFFEKKLKGVIGLIELSDKNKLFPNSSFFVQCIIKQKIFDSLFAFDNAEIMKKSTEFCKALYYNDEFPPEIGFKIWEMRVGKHEAALKQIYSLISILPSRKLTETFSIDLYKEISTVPQEQWDEDYIKMIKQYSVSAIGFVGMGEPIPYEYGFEILYNYAVAKKNQFSLTCLSEFLDRIQKTDSVEIFVYKCFQKINENQDSDVHTSILLKIIQEQFFSFKSLDPKVSDFIIDDIIRNSHDELDKIERRFELLTEVSKLLGIAVTVEEFMRLWTEYEGKQSVGSLYSWILKKKDGGKLQINARISSEIRAQIFQNIWQKYDDKSLQNISEREAEIMVEFFKSVNIVDGNIKRINVIIKTEQLDDLKGIETIWKAFEIVRSQNIAENLADLISEIYMTPSKFNQDKKEEWIKRLIKMFAEKLEQTYKDKNLEKVIRLMILPKKIIQRDEEIFTTKASKYYMMKDYTVVYKLNKEEKTIRFNVSGYCYDFKKMVADKFKIPFKRCKITCKGEQIKYENYFKTMNECAFHNSSFEVEMTPLEVSFVKEALNEQLNLFFELLGNRELEKIVWDVMSKLPIASEFVAKISHSQKPWESISDESIYKELYIMRVMNCMNEKWWNLFTQGPGLEILMSKFSRVSSKTKIQRQYLKMLCQEILKCLSMPEQKRKINYEELTLSMFKALNDLFEILVQEKMQNKSNCVQVQITTFIFSISQKISSYTNPLSILLSSFPQLEALLCSGLIVVENYFLRRQFSIKMVGFSEKLQEQDYGKYFDILFQRIFKLANNYEKPEKTKPFFSYVSIMIEKWKKDLFKDYLHNKNTELMITVKENLENSQPERTIETTNYKLLGNLLLMKQLVKYSEPEFQQRIAEFVFLKCFFSHLDKNGNDFKCKTKESRAEALQLLRSIIENGDKIITIVDSFSQLHKNALWRSRKFDDWTLTPGDKIKSASGYVGIKNLGCTCYMNSFFQQIFMIPEFRQAILQCTDPQYDEAQQVENVLYQLKKMFFNLQNSEKKFYTPTDFCNAFKNYQGQPTNVHEQMDIDQFSGMLFDRLENQMKFTPHENIVKDFFGGIFSNEIICKGCPHFSETQESFLSVSLSVKNKKNIYQSLDTMIKGDTLDGDNAYFCERCNKKVNAVKRVCFKKLPDHLFLTLKRFEFDFETMNKMKINDYCEFPTELNLKEYSQQYLRKQENPDRFDDEEILPDSYYDYVLKGVAIHLGYADSGHYYSFIKERSEEGKWYEFNDTIVRGFDVRKLAEEAFGGEIGTFQVKEKIKNAYMLFYERKKKIVDHSALVDMKADLTQIPIYSQLLQQINQENVIQKIQNILFSEEYTLFATNLIKATKKMPRESAIATLKYAVLVYLTVTIRQKEEAVSFEYLKKIHPVLIDYPEVYQWILTVFSSQATLQEFFKNNPAREIKKLLSQWLIEICLLSKPEKQHKFINALIFSFLKTSENNPEFCLIMNQLMRVDHLCDYAVERRVPGILIDNITRKVVDKVEFIEKQIQEYINEEDVSKQIGKEIIIEKTPYELSKKPRPNNQHPHIWGILSLVINRSKKLGKHLDDYLVVTKVEDLILPTVKIYKILEQARGKYMIKHFCKYLTYLAEIDERTSDELMVLIYRGLKDFESKRYRQFFTLMKNLLRIQDEFTAHRNRKGIAFMVKSLKDNEKFSPDNNIIQQWIIKLLRKNKNLRKALQEEPEALSYLSEMTTKKIPGEDVCRKNNYFLESTVNKYHGIKMMKTRKGYIDLSKQMEKFYEDIEQKVEPEVPEWESDEDLSEAEVKVGDAIFYFDQKDNVDFIEAKVQEILFGRLWISLEKSKIIPIWKDDEKLTAITYVGEAEEQSQEILCSDNTTEMDGEDDLLVD